MGIKLIDGLGGRTSRGNSSLNGCSIGDSRCSLGDLSPRRGPRNEVPTDDSGFVIPVTLTGSAELNPDDAAPLNSDALKNPLGVPLRVHELKWALQTMPTSPNVYLLSGAAVECNIAVGVNPITNTSVPLYNLGPTIDPEVEIGGKTYTGSNFTGQCFGVWKFDEPFYLEPGEGLDVQLKHRSLVPSAITVTMSISGTPVCDIPKRRPLPFVSSYTAAPIVLDPGETDLTRASTERDLMNPLPVPVRVRRFVGRLGVVSTPDASTIYWDPNTRHAVRDVLINMVMRDSQGVPTVGNSTPFGAVFPVPTHSIEIPHLMLPGAYYLATLTATVMAEADDIKAHPSISIIGYRDI